MRGEDYFRLIEEVADELRRWSGLIGLVFHDDADGLCSASISASALRKIKKEYRLMCIEKIHPAILKLVYSTGCKLFIFLDIGSGRADLITKMCEDSGSRAIILDHHDPMIVDSPLVVNLNPEIYGFSGERDVSGSTATYLLMRKLTDIEDSAWMAVVGSAEIPGPMTGLNKIPLEDSVKIGDVEVKRDHEESYYIRFLNKTWSRLSSSLTAIGSIGYYRGGPYRVVDYLLSRKIDFKEAEEMEEERKNRFAQASSIISKSKLKLDGVVQWFHIHNLFSGIGTKALGTFCSMLSYKRITAPDKYLVGFMDFEPNLPNLGRVEGEWIKVSVRTPRDLSEAVKSGEMPPASELTMKSAEAVGGSGDGHSFAASALIPRGREKEFIKIFNSLAVGRQAVLD
ncbi:MAG: DHH family phosphoesterase [Aigarchaeota archaeon]|nr:DHH family phosphoesterase [Aigarchaeota archaeon]MCX8192221.1 DHH family phosphoesterase [Nitrososphaeria archaeon]MDW7986171.1 DHH family phosphoesterase [Nitrososphaerota archaeon]